MKRIGVVSHSVLILLTASSCFQNFTVRQASSNGGNGADLSSLNGGVIPSANPPGTEKVEPQSIYLLPIQYSIPQGTFASPTIVASEVPNRVQGSVCTFNVRSASDGSVLATYNLLNFTNNESDMVDTLKNSEIGDYSEVSARNSLFSKMTGFKATLWNNPGDFINPTVAARTFYGSAYRASFPQMVDFTTFGLPSIPSGSFYVEVMGGDPVACGFDISLPQLKPVTDVSGVAIRSRVRRIGLWMSDEAGNLKLPGCAQDNSICQAGAIPNTAHSAFVNYSIVRGAGKKKNWFLVSIPFTPVDTMLLRFWGYSSSITQFNSANSQRCAGGASNTYRGNGTDSGYPLGQIGNQMCGYHNWFWDTQR